MTGQTYAKERDRLASELARLTAVAERRGEAETAEAVRALAKKLLEERFTVVIAGEFKRGKTTFVNALLGADILPVAVVPLTSVVTAVTWGNETDAEVTLSNGSVCRIEPEELATYVTERGNPKNRLEVERALLRYPAEELGDGVFLVDTPGVGSVFAHNTEAARAFMPEADAAIFLTTADPPISDAERGFLKDVRDEAARMFFVLNKVDYLSGPDRQEAIDFTHRVIADAVGHEVRIYPISAKEALRAKMIGRGAELETSGLPAFERDFRDFLLREKGHTILVSVAGRTRRVVGDLRNSIDVQERAAALPQEELGRTVDQMERVFALANERRDDLRALLQKEREVLVAMLESDLEELRRREERILRESTRRFLAGTEEIRKLGSELDELVRGALRSDIDRWRATEEHRIADAFQRATARFVSETERIAGDTIRLCGDILGLRLSPAFAIADLSPKTRFSYAFFEVPTILESILPDMRRYLPKGMARKLVERETMEEIPRLVDKHLGRLRHDFVRRLAESTRSLERELMDQLASTVESLRGGVRRAREERQRSAEGARQAADEAGSLRAELQDLDRRLQAVSAFGAGQWRQDPSQRLS